MGPQRYVTLRFVTLRCNAANSAQGNAMRLDESSTHTHMGREAYAKYCTVGQKTDLVKFIKCFLSIKKKEMKNLFSVCEW